MNGKKTPDGTKPTSHSPAGRCTMNRRCWGYCCSCQPAAQWEVMSRRHPSPRPWRLWCSCCCKPPAGRTPALHPVPTDWTGCGRGERRRRRKHVKAEVRQGGSTSNIQIQHHSYAADFAQRDVCVRINGCVHFPTCCCPCLSVASSSCLVTGSQEAGPAGAGGSGRSSSEVTTTGWSGSSQEGRMVLVGPWLWKRKGEVFFSPLFFFLF